MSQRANQLAEKIHSFSNEVIAFVNQLSDDNWVQTCEWEQWTVGVTAFHIGAGHLAIFNMAEIITKGETLPQLTMEQITEMANQQAIENTDCTKAEVLEQLQTNSAKMVAFTKSLSDEDLDSKGSMPAFGDEVTTEQLISFVLFQSAAQHFESIKSAVGN